MSLKELFIKSLAKQSAKKIRKQRKNALRDQDKIRRKLIKKAKYTVFGKDHLFEAIETYDDFKAQIPIRDYEELRPYIDQILDKKKNVLWPGVPKYFAKTSGTTSGVKYIPITKASIKYHIKAAREAIFNYIHLHKKASIFTKRVIFLSGSPVLSAKANIKTGRLSGLVNHEMPSWVKANQLPSYETNCIDDWETKLDRIVDETIGEDMSLISGIPPWVQMYYERLIQRSGKQNVGDLFPNFQLFIYGGVNFKPYRQTLEGLVGRSVDSLETYPASEGFIAYQDSWNEKGLLLNTKAGMFYEFIPLNEIQDPKPTRLQLAEVKTGIDYVLLITSNAGLWAYNIGDTVRFVSLNPYRLIVSGRVKHFISAFGEHVIAKEVEESLMTVGNEQNIGVVDFTVAPQITPVNNETPYHEWFIEFDQIPESLSDFEAKVDRLMREQNIYYDDLREGNILQNLKIRCLKKSAFRNYMKSKGKLGGQNKVPRLSNDRKIANELIQFKE